MPYVSTQVYDTTGMYAIDVETLPHAYTFNGSNNLLTDTVTQGNNVFVKTFAYTGANLTSESGWVKQ